MTNVWTDALSEKIAELWKTNSASQISAILWRENRASFTRNAIVGKLHRMNCRIEAKERVHPSTSEKASGLKARPTPVNVDRIIQAKARVRPQIVCVDPDSIVSLNIHFDDLQDGDCKWPYDAESGSMISHVFCGHPSLEGRPYCIGHTIKAKQPVQPRKPSTPTTFGQSKGGVFGRVA